VSKKKTDEGAGHPETRTAEVFNLDRFKATQRTEKLKAEAAVAAKAKKTEKPKRAPAVEPFIRLPYERFLQTYSKRPLSSAAWYVAAELDRQHFVAFGAHKNPVTLSNRTRLGELGMPRNTKARALRELRDAGLISFTQKGHEAFIVTLSWHPVL
jgi:hypothetical protein